MLRWFAIWVSVDHRESVWNLSGDTTYTLNIILTTPGFPECLSLLHVDSYEKNSSPAKIEMLSCS